MFYRFVAYCLAFGLTAFPARSYGQRPSPEGSKVPGPAEPVQPVRPGDRIRVNLADSTLSTAVGHVVALTAATLYLSPEHFGASHRAVPLDRITGAGAESRSPYESRRGGADRPSGRNRDGSSGR